MTTSRPTLPPELHRQIIDSGLCSKADLCSVAQASRLLRDEGQRVLFRDPGLIDVGEEKERGRTKAFFEAILSSPHRLALMVCSYSQTIKLEAGTTQDGQNGIRNRSQVEIYTWMTEALKLMVNLTVFHSQQVGPPSDYITCLMVDCMCQCTFKLKEFSWRHEGHEIRLLEEFLSYQIEVESLYFYPGFDIGSSLDATNQPLQRLLMVGQKACPKLATLCGPLSTSMVFLPGKRQLKFVDWTWATHGPEGLADTQSYVTHICVALHSVQLLEYDLGAASVLPFSQVSPYLRNLVVLLISNDRLREVSELSDGLPELRAIHFFEGYCNVSTPEEFARDHAFVSRIFTLCRKLRLVDIDRHLARSTPQGDAYGYGLASRRFEVSRETGSVVATKVDRSNDDWWEDRARLVAKISMGSLA